jgi:peptidoglycan/xylan/chitin deacetylase (PgdA/CDA1 family)
MRGLRADRAATLYLFDPLRRVLPTSTGVPILMYHRVPDVDTCTCHPYYCTSTAAPVFEEQMRFLQEAGYRTITVREAFQAAQKATSEHEQKLVSITFDDGYRDFYTNAFPILNRFGLSATVFLSTAYIGDTPHRFNGAECLTWSEVRALRRAGIHFESHTITHPQLTKVSPERLRRELADSKAEIEHRLSESIEYFSYPYAFPEANRPFIRSLRRSLEETGYRGGVSTQIGLVRDPQEPFFMKRVPVNTHDDSALLLAKLSGAYDWVGRPQYVAKQLNHIVKYVSR